MKLFLSMLIGLGLAGTSVEAQNSKRKVAQAKVTCVPLGIPFDPWGGGAGSDSINYTAEELSMLRNSIYAQVGFKFQTPKVTDEMARRGCLNKEVKFTSTSLQKVDKKNISLLKSLEKSIRESEGVADFDGPWSKASKSGITRTKLLSGNYCFLSDALGKYFGIIYFDGGKQLNGMMNLNKPSWAEPMTDEEKSSYGYSVAYKELDTTSAVILDYATKGTWMVADNGQVQISINSDYKNIKNGVINVSSPRYAENRMLDCQLAK